MAVEIKSKKAVVSKAPHELYMAFVDMRNFVNFLPEDKKEGVTADYDSIHAEVQGFNIGLKVIERTSDLLHHCGDLILQLYYK